MQKRNENESVYDYFVRLNKSDSFEKIPSFITIAYRVLENNTSKIVFYLETDKKSEEDEKYINENFSDMLLVYEHLEKQVPY